MLQTNPHLRPAELWFVMTSLLLATFLELAPFGRYFYLPDILLVVLIFWNIHYPRWIGVGVAWTLGLLMDAHTGTLFGQHALAWALLSHAAIAIHRRVLWFSPMMQAIHLLPLFLGAQLADVCIRMLSGGMFPSPWIFTESLMTAALWPLAQWVLQWPQRVPAPQDEEPAP